MRSIITVLIFFIGGIGYLAHSALPGDFLYSVKIYGNENVLRGVSVTDSKKAKFNATLAGRRLYEVEKLSEKNRLETDVFKDLRKRFDGNVQEFIDISEKIETVNPKNAGELRSAMEVNLAMHRDILSKVSHMGKNSTEMEEFVASVEEKRLTISQNRMKLEEKEFDNAHPEDSATLALLFAQQKIEEAKKTLEDKKKIKNSSELIEAEKHLKIAEGAFAEGKAKLDVPAYADAFALFKKAERETLAVKLFMLTEGKNENLP